MKRLIYVLLAVAIVGFAGCQKKETPKEETKSPMQEKVDEFASVRLTTDLSHLSQNEKELIKVFLEIGQIMDDLFWKQAYGNKTDIDTISDKAAREFAMINYGPWERLNNMKPFVEGYGEKPQGANFYPIDMTDEEYNALKDKNKDNLYTVIRRDSEGKLVVKWYREEYKEELQKVDKLMEKAISLADDAGLKKYLTERRKAFQTDDYFQSDMAWMDMKQSKLVFVVGPIENYEDRRYGSKAAYESFILVKDEKWSNDLAKFTAMLPQLQKELPVDPKFKKEIPGTDSDLNVYDVIFYGGDCNAGSKTIAINLPNDERVQLKKGARRLQLKNSMKAKFDKILMPIAEQIMVQDQLKNIKFDAFFSNVTFHEVAHGLGIKNTINGKGSVRKALENQYSGWEEAKADILGLYMVVSLIEKGEITNITQEDAYATFIAGILRSVRFGAASAHGKANMMCFNYFEENGAFARNQEGKYVIDFTKAKQAMESWAALVIKVEGEGDLEFAKAYNEKNGVIKPELQKDLDKINSAKIPKDIRFEQGKSVLGL
ncbi:MAG: Zn-dependent hydrolase [Bacteroidales bacterium]|nr:Zn-dependent hydrolase [Bacteroidales bacterium]